MGVITTSNGKYVHFNTGAGANASTEAIVLPVESFTGLDSGDDLIRMNFLPITASTEANNCNVELSVAAGKQANVMIEIARAMSTMNAGVLTIFDGDENISMHSDITAAAINVNEAS